MSIDDAKAIAIARIISTSFGFLFKYISTLLKE
jgi:hypothetical protein